MKRNPLLRYCTETPTSLGSYLDLDDSAVWSALAALAQLSSSDLIAAHFAQRLRERRLYKCVDIGIQDQAGSNLYSRVKGKLRESYPEYESLLFDDEEVSLYKWYDFADSSALNKVLVKTRAEDQEPRDIANVSSIVPALREAERIQRLYASDEAQASAIRQIMEEVKE